jgi:hypothetical protein
MYERSVKNDDRNKECSYSFVFIGRLKSKATNQECDNDAIVPSSYFVWFGNVFTRWLLIFFGFLGLIVATVALSIFYFWLLEFILIGSDLVAELWVMIVFIICLFSE